MTWYIGLDSMVAVEESEADTEKDAIEIARQKIMEWLQSERLDFAVDLDWNIEYER